MTDEERIAALEARVAALEARVADAAAWADGVNRKLGAPSNVAPPARALEPRPRERGTDGKPPPQGWNGDKTDPMVKELEESERRDGRPTRGDHLSGANGRRSWP